jgi:hypothetical protein
MILISTSSKYGLIGWFMVLNATFNKYFSYIVAVSFFHGGNGITGENHDLSQVGVRTHNLSGDRH